mmetsp:Transcript_17934/g.29923  ORF Transcript_17934/g.29923 Transcript_17934/m.29923 type:complete len:114 (-) Transcript_17934:96-437(-)
MADHRQPGGPSQPPLLAWANQRVQANQQIPTLTQLALDQLAQHPEMIDDIGCTDEHLAIGLLWRLMKAGRLDFRLACIFRDSGHESIREAIGGLNLLDAVPMHNVLGRNRWPH